MFPNINSVLHKKALSVSSLVLATCILLQMASITLVTSGCVSVILSEPLMDSKSRKIEFDK